MSHLPLKQCKRPCRIHECSISWAARIISTICSFAIKQTLFSPQDLFWNILYISFTGFLNVSVDIVTNKSSSSVMSGHFIFYKCETFERYLLACIFIADSLNNIDYLVKIKKYFAHLFYLFINELIMQVYMQFTYSDHTLT